MACGNISLCINVQSHCPEPNNFGRNIKKCKCLEQCLYDQNTFYVNTAIICSFY